MSEEPQIIDITDDVDDQKDIPGLPDNAILMIYHPSLGQVPVSGRKPSEVRKVMQELERCLKTGTAFYIQDPVSNHPLFVIPSWQIEHITSVGIAWQDPDQKPQGAVLPASMAALSRLPRPSGAG